MPPKKKEGGAAGGEEVEGEDPQVFLQNYQKLANSSEFVPLDET